MNYKFTCMECECKYLTYHVECLRCGGPLIDTDCIPTFTRTSISDSDENNIYYISEGT